MLSSNLVSRSLRGNKLFKTALRSFCGSIDELQIPTIDLDKFLNKSQNWERECKLAAECLHDTGIMIVRDPVRINFLIKIFKEKSFLIIKIQIRLYSVVSFKIEFNFYFI